MRSGSHGRDQPVHHVLSGAAAALAERQHAGAGLCFALHKHGTFGTRGGAEHQLRLYLLMQGVSLLLNNLLLALFIAAWAWPPLPAKLLQIGIVFLWIFSFCKLVIFRPATQALLPRP